MSKIRNKLIATLTIFAILFTSLSAVMFAGSNFAKAEGEESAVIEEVYLELQDGASSGYLGEATDGKNYAGLRWETKIKKANYDKLVEDYRDANFIFGTIIAPAEFEDYLNFDPNADKKIVFEDGDWYIYDSTKDITNKNGEKIYVSNIVNEENVASKMSTIDASGEYIMRSAIRYDELDENLIAQAKTELVAKAYVEITNADDSVEYEYSTADTVRSLRNSVAYNLAAGNFSEADAASLKKFAVAEDKTYAKLDGDVLYSVNNEAYRETTVNFGDFLKGKNAEFALNSTSYKDVDYNKDTGVVTLGDNFFDDLKQGAYYLTAFCEDGNVYYAEILKATTISTAEELTKTFRLVDTETAGVNSSSYLKYTDTIDMGKTFEGYYVLTNNIDASSLTDDNRLYSWAPNYDESSISLSGIESKGLTGTFDGRGYAISNLTVRRGGLFGVVNGTVKNLALKDFNHSLYGTRKFGGSTFVAYWITKTAVFENFALYGNNNNAYYSFATHLSIEAKLTNCYIESPFSLPHLDGTDDSNYLGLAPREDGSILDNIKNTIFVSEYVFRGKSDATSYDVMDVTGGTGKFLDLNKGSYTINAETKASASTAKRYQTAEDLATRYALGDNDTLAIDKNVTPTKTVIDSFENCGNFAVIDGKICWASLSQVYLNNELLTVSELELAVGESVEIKVLLGESTLDFKIISDSKSVPDSNGIIMAEEPGTANLSVVSKGVVLAKLTVNVPKVVVNNTNTIIVDANGEEFIVPEGWIENKTAVSLNGALVEDCTVEVDGNDVSLKFLNEKDYANKEYVVTFETDTTIYNYKVKYVTAYIRTTEEFVETFSLAEGDLTSASTTDQLATFDGYYMLANNIDFKGKDMPTEAFTLTDYIPNSTSTGLTGTFDGDGYAIYNLVAPEGGVFGVVSGKLMNVAFINCDTTNSGIVAKYSTETGSFSNVYVRYSGDYSDSKYLFIRYPNHNVSLTNCYFEGNLRLYWGSTSGASVGNNSALVNSGNTAIVITKHILGVRGSATGYHVEGNSAGSTSSKAYYDDTTTSGTNIRLSCSGEVYRYENVEKLSDMYTNKDSAYTDKTGAVQTLVGKFSSNKYYSVGSTGKIAWAKDTASYSVYADSTLVEGNTINLQASGDESEAILSVKNLADVEVNGCTFSLSNNASVVEFDEDTIKLTAKKEGTATLTVKIGNEVVRVITIKVTKEIIDRTSEPTVLLDANGEEFTIADGTIIGGIVSGGTVVVNGNNIALSFEDEAAAANKEYVVGFETENAIYNYKVKYVTAYIRTAKEFVETFSLAKGDLTTATTAEQLATFDGYYMLANNIDFNGKDMPTDTFTFAINNGSGAPACITTLRSENVMYKYGLTGTFDGNGNTIYNLITPNGGLFGLVSGTIKNVGFIQLSSVSPASGVLARYMYETALLENVYIKSNAYDSKPVASGALLAAYADKNLELSNCYFEINLHLYNGTTSKDSSTALGGHVGESSAIIVSKQLLSNQWGLFNQTARNADANKDLSNVTKYCDGSTNYSASYYSSKPIYRYDDASKLSETYNETEVVEGQEVATARQTALREFIAKTFTTYYSVSDAGVISWIGDTGTAE